MTGRERQLLSLFICVATVCVTALRAFNRLDSVPQALPTGRAPAQQAAHEESVAELAEIETLLDAWKTSGAFSAGLAVARAAESFGARAARVDRIGEDNVRLTLEGSGPSLLAALSHAERSVPGLLCASVSLGASRAGSGDAWTLALTLSSWTSLYADSASLGGTLVGYERDSASGDPRAIAARLGMRKMSGSAKQPAPTSPPHPRAVSEGTAEAFVESIAGGEAPRFEVTGSFFSEGVPRYFATDRETGRTLVAEAVGIGENTSKANAVTLLIDGLEYETTLPWENGQ